MKKMMIIALSAAIVLSLFTAMPLTAAASGNWTDYASEGFAGRDGSSGSRYEIGTAAQSAHLEKSSAIGSPQSASSVSITGTAAVGQTLTGSYTYNAGSASVEGNTAFRWLRVSSTPSFLDQPYLLYSTHNISLVKSAPSGPSSPAQFTVTGPAHIVWIGNYHYNVGYVPGTISLEDSNGTVYGPWATEADVNRYHWSVSPDIEIPAGTYTVVDSHPESWSFNSSSGNAGMLEIVGYTVISGATGQTYTLQPADGGHSILFEVTPEDADGNRGPAALSAKFGPVMMVAAGSGGGSGDTGNTAAAEATPEETGEPEETPQATPAKTKLPDSGVRFSDLSGQVKIWIPIGYDDGGAPVYGAGSGDFAQLDSELPVGTRIETYRNSSVILSFADMTTFVMKPESEVVLMNPQAKDSQFKLPVGNLWVNFQTVMRDGSMDIEMSQAVAGIRGATFVLEDDGVTSTLKVIGGTVEFTSKTTGESVMVEGSETVRATADGLGDVGKFDVGAEMADWAEYGAKIPSEGFPLWAILAIGGGVALIALIVVIAAVSSRKKRKTAAAHPACAPGAYPPGAYPYPPPIYPYPPQATYPSQGAYPPPTQSARPAVPCGFCTQCGTPLSPGAAFCIKCGNKTEI